MAQVTCSECGTETEYAEADEKWGVECSGCGEVVIEPA